MYHIKEIHYTLQGEGHHAGRQAIFIRFTGCNLWSGREQDRSKAICRFCDTDFIGTDGHLGGKYEVDTLIRTIRSLWPSPYIEPYLVLTGGEPLLQVDDFLIQKLREERFIIAIETNGTRIPPSGIHWVCMSPKSGSDILLTKGNELKLVYPQEGQSPEDFIDFEFDHFYLQPLFDEHIEAHTSMCLEYVRKHPRWQLSRQMHKVWNIP